jgi:hypothetical protein
LHHTPTIQGAATVYDKNTNGRTLRLEPVRTPFDPNTYVAQLGSMKVTAHEQVLVTVAKAGREVTMSS